MSVQNIAASAYYQSIFASRRSEELAAIAQTKRFVERLTADDTFADKLRNKLLDADQLRVEYGIDIDPQQLLPLWQEQSAEIHADAWPLVDSFRRFQGDLRVYRMLSRSQGDTSLSCPRFHAWRSRQIARCASEFPNTADAITFSVAAFELSQGCSLGCWFCGVSAEKYVGHFPYTTENAALWHGVVKVIQTLFGSASHTGFCYWATDPCDNPDYAKFIAAYHEVTGQLPQTTTAAPFKNPALTQEILRLFAEHRSAPCRFSVLSLRVLQQLHQQFSALDLLGVELICQNKESSTVMAAAGRAIERQQRLREGNRPREIGKLTEEHATIACVSGFLVNMMTRTVQLVTPVRADQQWPNGFRVLDERQFVSADNFNDICREMIERHMPESLPAEGALAFRPDLIFAPLPDGDRNGFHLRNPWAEHKIMGLPFMRDLGQLIARGRHNATQLSGLLSRDGVDALQVSATLQYLFDGGFLAEWSPPQVAGLEPEMKMVG